MGKRRTKPMPPLTPRGREIVRLVFNSVAVGTHDDDAEVGAMAERLGTSPGRLQSLLRKLEEQGWVAVKHDFVYPTVAALRWQNPNLDERAAAKLLRSLR
jgi:DNA-binding IclR family transcriptional regulator